MTYNETYTLYKPAKTKTNDSLHLNYFQQHVTQHESIHYQYHSWCGLGIKPKNVNIKTMQNLNNSSCLLASHFICGQTTPLQSTLCLAIYEHRHLPVLRCGCIFQFYSELGQCTLLLDCKASIAICITIHVIMSCACL